MEKQIPNLYNPLDRVKRYSLGANFVDNSLDRGQIELGMTALSRNAGYVLSSEHPDDTRAVERISQYFKHRDYATAHSDLEDTLTYPIAAASGNILEWVRDAMPNDLEKFCLWSLERTQNLTSALTRDKQYFDDKAYQYTKSLVGINYFPSQATRIVEKEVADTELVGMDAFYSGGRGWGAVFWGPRKIAVPNHYENPRAIKTIGKDLDWYFYHENLHRAGHGRLLFPDDFDDQGLINEAFVEHSNVVAHAHRWARQSNVVAPGKRTRLNPDMGIYSSERTFLDYVINHTRLSIEQLGDAYFSNRNVWNERKRRVIKREIIKLFGSTEQWYELVDDYDEANSNKRSDILKSKLAEFRKRTI